jgi:CRISPR-associated protein Cas6
MAIVDLRFPARALTPIHLNHGYDVLSAVSRVVPAVHGNPRIGILPIRGIRVGAGRLRLDPDSSVLAIRAPADFLPELLPLTGQRILIGDVAVRLGCPQIHPLRACPALASRVVTIKGYMEPETFRQALVRQLDALRLSRRPEVDIGPRRAFRIKGVTVVGFAVRLDGLSDGDSITVQAAGLGGRRRIGSGVFVPVSTRVAAKAGG